MKNLHAILTGLCAICLAGSFIPGASLLAYLGVIFGGVFAIQSSFESLKQRQIDVDLLMVVAAVGAVLVKRPEDACALLFLFSLSGTLEEMAMGKTQSAIEGLIKLRPAQALRIRNGVEERVNVEELKLEDLVKVPAFETIPVDGVITEGQSSVDQSAMTGESIAVPCEPGTKVLGGTQNMDGLLVVRVTSTVGDSTLDKIVALVEDAQNNKASGEKISNWFGQRYTVFVLVTFIVAFAIRLLLHEKLEPALYGALTLLVALSPCALVISIPATTLSALAWSARNGMLVRGGGFIELAGKVDTVAFDKTGTLTLGKAALQEICVCVGNVVVGHDNECGAASGCWIRGADMSEAAMNLLRLAAAVEQYANHPVAEAVIVAAREHNIDVPEATENKTLPGLGVTAVVDGQKVSVGQVRMMKEMDLHLPDEFIAHVTELQSQGLTVAVLYSESGLAALGFSDVPRSNAKEVIQDLRDLGVKEVVMLTGDTIQTAGAVAKEVGVTEVHAGLLPQQKTEIIEGLARKGNVMMVGDGVNDAPSLALASVGVAMGGLGSDIALNAADVVLMNDRLDNIPLLIRLGRKTNAIITVNLAFAGAMIMVLAVSSLVSTLPLPIAVLGHEGSTVLVILNGLRLLRGPKIHAKS